MHINNVTLEAVGVDFSQYPEETLPEIAFVGRSNVGKSSLINSLINRKALAKTSSTPGKTRTINFYNVEDTLYLVDLPGYGYAKVSKEETTRWSKMIDEYLTNRKTLVGIIMVVDLRHPPQDLDIQMLEWIRHFDHYVNIVATKKDKLKRSQLQKNMRALNDGFRLTEEAVLIPFSSVTGEGKTEIWKMIDWLADTSFSNK